MTLFNKLCIERITAITPDGVEHEINVAGHDRVQARCGQIRVKLSSQTDTQALLEVLRIPLHFAELRSRTGDIAEWLDCSITVDSDWVVISDDSVMNMSGSGRKANG